MNPFTKSMLDLLLFIGEALLTVICVAMAVVALCSVFEGWLL